MTAPSPLPTDEDARASLNALYWEHPEVGGRTGLVGHQIDAVLAWMEREGFRRAVVSTPPCPGCGGDGVEIDDDPESTRQIVTTCGICGGAGSAVVSTPDVRALIDEARATDEWTSSNILGALVDALADALEASAVSAPPTITDEAAAFDSAIRGVEAWHSDDERTAAQYAGVREGLIRGREIALRRFCVCMPAIAGISDGPNVECPVHGETREGAF